MHRFVIDDLRQWGAEHTAREIEQQPSVWQELLESMQQRSEETEAFLEKILARHQEVRVVFSGAGTSAFVGDTLVPLLRKSAPDHVFQFESIATTDIVSNPKGYFIDRPTILVSFARSGNSPESVATVQLADQLLTDVYHVTITCNREGQLARRAEEQRDNSLLILMPDRAHDQSFAMTSSFTCMMYAACGLFLPDVLKGDELTDVCGAAEQLLQRMEEPLERLVALDCQRVIYLGSGGLGQLAHEAALKMQELSGGRVAAFHETSLGFRHGPKSLVDDRTVVVFFISADPYTRQYDLDMLRELDSEGENLMTVVLHQEDNLNLSNAAEQIKVEKLKRNREIYLSMLYILFAQAYAFRQSLALGITPDNPSTDGRVNRVVQGVTIYDFPQKK